MEVFAMGFLHWYLELGKQWGSDIHFKMNFIFNKMIF